MLKIKETEAANVLLTSLLPPKGYVLSTIDASTGTAHITFKLDSERTQDWHLQGEILNAAGEDIREPLYLIRHIKNFQTLLDTYRIVNDTYT